jgi:cytoskeletal protein CcmA (bactofilin family)
MWKSSRKEDEFMAQTPEQTAPKPAYNSAPPAVRAPEPVRSDAPRSVDVATIGKSVIVKGELSGSEDLYVDGEVEGSINLRGQSLTIGPNGRVHANIEARNVIVHGRVDGNIKASDRVDLRKSASLAGDISTARVAIEDGAFFKGSIDIQKPEATPRVEPKPPAVAVAPTPAPDAASTAQGSLLEPKKF